MKSELKQYRPKSFQMSYTSEVNEIINQTILVKTRRNTYRLVLLHRVQ